jgi:hypothetical protein
LVGGFKEMKTLQKIIFFILSFSFLKSEAQVSSHICRNQVFIEALGNNFADPNSSADAGLATINYSRKVILKNSSFMFSLGVGLLREDGTTPPITIVDFPIGVLCRGKYKRNGLWFGVFCSSCFGKIYYLDEKDNNHLHNASFQISPNLTYQFQSESEHCFIRFSLTPKILASAFTSTYEYGYGVKLFPFWGGISIGGGW